MCYEFDPDLVLIIGQSDSTTLHLFLSFFTVFAAGKVITILCVIYLFLWIF